MLKKLEFKKQNYIISLGGSLIVPEKIDTGFLKAFRKIILAASRLGNRFIIVPGGGQTCRNYQKVARMVARVTDEDLDWIGIAANNLHSHLLLTIFGKQAYPELVKFEKVPQKILKSVAVAYGGIVPGGSSDSTAVAYARKFGVKIIVNLTNVVGIYSRDPTKYKNAKLITRLTWQEFRRKFGSSRKPGQHLPFDPSIASHALKLGLKVVVLDGRNLKDFQAFLNNKNFTGTIIE